MADKMDFETLQNWLPGLTRYRFKIARHHRILHGRGSVVSTVSSRRMYVSPKQLDHFLDFITSAHIVQDLPFGEKTLKLSTKEEIAVPNTIRTLIPERIVQQHNAFCCENSLQGLDYFTAQGVKAFEDLEGVVEEIGEKCGKGSLWVHTSMRSSVPDHCRAYALSYPGDQDYLLDCDHDHEDRCDRCSQLASVVAEIKKTLETSNCSNHTKDELNFDSRTILAILNDVFHRLKGVMPQLQSVYLRQDNAGCYHCSLSIVTARQHDEECLRVWKAYKIGPGKLVLYSKFNCPSELPSLSSSSDNSVKVNFVPIKPRRIKKPTADLKDDQNDGKDDDDNDTDDDYKPKDALFSCPEEGCTKSYQRYSSLLNHIECGLHKRSLECETLYDRAIMGYASRLEQGATAIPELGLGKEVRITAYSAPSLPMGWALKCSRTRGARFSTKQKEYLSAKFQIGERTGLKADPASVATAVRKAKDVNGEQLFDNDDEDEDHTAHLPRENHSQEMRDNIVTSMSIQNAHPIVYDSLNICELVQKSKLASFSIKLLQEICSSFGLDISNIKIKRKQPYINILRELVKGCKCQLGTVK
ncbi:unnamed protein product [Pocillopora meandrina]|uniref:C2H2-type domain-containing protein n=1 Tax=Pocillopora meandrina TaxID=46732 RepID=A0AAU9WT14_9CNID|nr:unnamed protein product [Pocillopora meandrina]